MKIIFYFISLLTLMACVNERQLVNKELKSDKLVSEIFNDEEIVELGKIIYFFENVVIKENKSFRIEDRYNNFLSKDSLKYVEKNEMYVFDYNLQNSLYYRFNKKFFNDFWVKAQVTRNPGSIQEIKTDYFHLKVYEGERLSKYGQFVKEFSNKNKELKNYFNSIKLSNEFFTPITPIELVIYHNKFNKKDIKMRLIYAFHYMSVNEYYKDYQ